MSYDLHTHSTASDGSLTPTELVHAAAAAGICQLALTDHDCTSGLAEAREAAAACGVWLLPAVEISCTWQGRSVHVVGLAIDPHCKILQAGLVTLQAIREKRAEEMGRRLESAGIPGAYAAARARAGKGMITRTHFAHFLVARGLSTTIGDVFGRYLTPGKPGYVPTEWAPIGEAIAWIRAAGGIATLAHPQRYKLTGSGLRRLLVEFKNAGGEALEVVSGAGLADNIQTMSHHARRLNLLGSVGSDFHGPDLAWLKLGRLPPLPPNVTPVWSRWDD